LSEIFIGEWYLCIFLFGNTLNVHTTARHNRTLNSFCLNFCSELKATIASINHCCSVGDVYVCVCVCLCACACSCLMYVCMSAGLCVRRLNVHECGLGVVHGHSTSSRQHSCLQSFNARMNYDKIKDCGFCMHPCILRSNFCSSQRICHVQC